MGDTSRRIPQSIPGPGMVVVVVRGDGGGGEVVAVQDLCKDL